MELSFSGDIQNLITGLEVIASKEGITITEHGYPIEVVQGDKIIVQNDQDGGMIQYVEKVQFFRSLSLWLNLYREKEYFNLEEEPQFNMTGSMIDLSRNAVLKVDELKDYILMSARMGLNTILLYMEDTFEVKSYPYFGYMRGRYTQEELEECDSYASHLGVELIPCIQTLAHLKHALKWNYAADMKDTADILLVGSDKTYQFLTDIIESASKPFKTNKIHIGMDEAHQLGLGKYLSENGYEPRFDIMNKHLKEVIQITNNLELEPMIWSDMYFRLGSKINSYYDEESVIPQEIIDDIPDVDLVYWDYYHTEQSFYERFIQKHKQIKDKVIFAGGAWTWNGISPNYGKAFKTTESALAACKEEDVKDVFITIWGDDGAETPYVTAYPTLQMLAEHSYTPKPTDHLIKERFEFHHNINWDDIFLLNALDEVPGVSEGNYHESNPSKFLLWQDILIGLYDKNIEGLSIAEHYERLEGKLNDIAVKDEKWSKVITFYQQLASVLKLKSELGIRIQTLYKLTNKLKMKIAIKEVNELIAKVESLHAYHRDLWLLLYKPFGFEVIDVRYGGLIQRLKTAKHRLDSWVNGSIRDVEELNEERLYFEGPYKMPAGSIGRNLYKRIISASDI